MIFKNITKVDKSYSEILHPGHVPGCRGHRYLEFNSRKEMKDFVNFKGDRIVISDEVDDSDGIINLQNIKLKKVYLKVNNIVRTSSWFSFSKKSYAIVDTKPTTLREINLDILTQ